MLCEAIARQPAIPRFLCHLFQRLRANRLNLVTGAGISVDAGVPLWKDLLVRLASRSDALRADLEAHHASGLHPEYLGQIIFHRHRDEWQGDASPRLRDAYIEQGWAKAIHDAIYRDVIHDVDKILKNHPYLAQLRDLARKVPLVINFNFDDLLADAMGRQIELREGSSDRNFATVWDPPLVDRPNTSTVYHVNGLLPREGLKKRSPQLVFTEDSFAAAIVRAPSVSDEYLFLRFIQNTMLIVGHSLGDSSLKNYLRRNREKMPSNYHYMIHWMVSDDVLSESQRKDLFDANLELYNVITIFLTSEEICNFFALLNSCNRNMREFLEAAEPDRRSRYHYYIVGPVAAGKSTILEQLRCFNTFEEWTRRPPKLMYRSSVDLSDDEQRQVDQFVYSELKEKNLRMERADVGFHFMDRAPLDLYAFPNDAEKQRRKTAELREEVVRDAQFRDGEIIFITASPQCLERRNLKRGRIPNSSGDSIYLKTQSETLQSIYSPSLVLETDELLPGEIARRVAYHALFGPYNPVSFAEIMNRFE